ncbi:hypothetical protein AAG906_026419 [Vitis piasezkii]
MEEAKTMKTPMSSSIKLYKDEKGKSIDSTMYRGMIGRLEARVSDFGCLLFLLHITINFFSIFACLVRLWIYLGYLMMMHMISCCKNTTRVLPYGRFLTRVFKDIGIDLSREIDFEAPSAYDTRAERPLVQARGQEQAYPRVDEEVEIREMEGGISSLGTRMEELAVVNILSSTPWRLAWISIRLASLHSLSISSRGLSVLRIAWINIRLASLHSFSISNSRLSVLRIAWRISMRR